MYSTDRFMGYVFVCECVGGEIERRGGGGRERERGGLPAMNQQWGDWHVSPG